MTGMQLIEEMEKAISDGYTKGDHVYLFFEYVPEVLWNEIRRRLLG